MMIVMQQGATEEQIRHVVDRIGQLGARAHLSSGEFVTVIGAIGDDRELASVLALDGEPGVEKVVPIMKPYKIVSREFHKQDRILDIAGRKVGGDNFCLISGPCTVETREQTLETAEVCKAVGSTMLRGGAFKPRTSPYTFQGLGKPALEILAEARELTGLPIVTECMDIRQLEDVLEVADVIQLGARNMQNFDLLAEVGRSGRPVLLKRGLSNTIEEWLLSAEYIAKEGNDQIMLCERGIRTFETAYRNVLDVTAIPVLKRETHLPVIVDPSHAGGKAWLVADLACAAVAAGADGLLVEVHPNPPEAWCDADQALTPEEFAHLMRKLDGVARALGRTLDGVDALTPTMQREGLPTI